MNVTRALTEQAWFTDCFRGYLAVKGARPQISRELRVMFAFANRSMKTQRTTSGGSSPWKALATDERARPPRSERKKLPIRARTDASWALSSASRLARALPNAHAIKYFVLKAACNCTTAFGDEGPVPLVTYGDGKGFGFGFWRSLSRSRPTRVLCRWTTCSPALKGRL